LISRKEAKYIADSSVSPSQRAGSVKELIQKSNDKEEKILDAAKKNNVGMGTKAQYKYFRRILAALLNCCHDNNFLNCPLLHFCTFATFTLYNVTQLIVYLLYIIQFKMSSPKYY